MDYLTRAQTMGQDVDALQRGEIITGPVTVNTIAEYRAIFGAGQCDAHRAAYAGLRPAENGIEPGMQSLLDHVYGTQELTPELDDLSQKLFPMTILVTSAADMSISSDIVIGPSGQSYALNVGTLTFDGGSLTVNNTVSTITADNLIITAQGSQSSNNSYQIGIIGNTGATGTTGNAGQAYASAASTGAAGNPVIWGTCTSSGTGGTGGTGSEGQQGQTGGAGGDGAPSLNSTITITAFDPSNVNAFVIQTYSGAGGTGGTGGQGGAGQTGGTGGAGCNSGCEGSNGGTGGDGGQGGTGGTGGQGGNGVSGNPITINWPSVAKTMLIALQSVAPAGAGGQGGAPGAAGSGGGGGTGGKHNDNGSGGAAGAPGSTGAVGDAGTQTGAPAAYSYNYTS